MRVGLQWGFSKAPTRAARARPRFTIGTLLQSGHWYLVALEGWAAHLHVSGLTELLKTLLRALVSLGKEQKISVHGT